jgi:hypothetical protein
MFLQKLLKSILPKNMADQMEAESRSWMLQCPNCKYEQSYWEIGGIRWGASGKPKIYRPCKNCSQLGWHTVYRKSQ